MLDDHACNVPIRFSGVHNSPFSEVGAALVGGGYPALPIMPGEKKPGTYNRLVGWRPMKRWTDYCFKLPLPNVIAEWTKWPDAGVGVACGRGLICIDIDHEPAMSALIALLPVSNVQKKGRKGISLFYRGNTELIRSKNYRTPEKVGLVDLLAEGRQTVLPPSAHPETHQPYHWWTDATLLDTPLDRLNELPDNIAGQLAEALKKFGYDPEAERRALLPSARVSNVEPVTGASSIYRKANDDAMALFDCWVPALCLYKLKPKAGGFEAVATWRRSGSGKPLNRRERHLSIDRRGIKDFGTDDKYTPIDLVMKARDVDKTAALNWLLERLPQEPPIVLRK